MECNSAIFSATTSAIALGSVATTVSAFGGCPGYTKSVGQPIGKGEVFFVDSLSQLFSLDLLECRYERLLVWFFHRPVRRWKRAVIFFLDMLPEEPNIALPVLDEPL